MPKPLLRLATVVGILLPDERNVINVFEKFTLAVISRGPLPKLRGMIWSPGRGFGLKIPKRVTIAPGLPALANAGRSVKNVSPLLSSPVVILNGEPDAAEMYGLI